MRDDAEDLDLPFLAVAWAHTARTILVRANDFDDRLSASAPTATDPLTVADSWQRNADAHFAFVALAQVVKICDLIPALPAFPDAETLALLRNFAEHWEDPEGRSGRALRSMNFDPLGVGVLWLAEQRYLTAEANAEVREWLSEVDRVARSLAADAEEPIPLPSDPLV